MKAALKKAKRIKRVIKKVFYFLLIGCIVFFTVAWLLAHYPQIERYFSRFTDVAINTSQIDAYYDLLSKHKRSGKDLVLELGVSDKESLHVVMDKLKALMGLGDYLVGLEYHNDEKPPAYISNKNGDMTIFVSTKIKGRREEVNILAHELSHIYVWRLKPSIFGKCDQEKLVDCSSVFLGLGVFTLNGLTDEYVLLPDGGYQTQKKQFGYLAPEQFGYLLARYCIEHKIKSDSIKQFLSPAAWKYFQFGSVYIKKRALGGSSVAENSVLCRLIKASRKMFFNLDKGISGFKEKFWNRVLVS